MKNIKFKITAVLLALCSILLFSNFETVGYDTYYLWSYSYYLGSIIVTTLFFSSYSFVVKALHKVNRELSKKLTNAYYRIATTLFAFVGFLLFMAKVNFKAEGKEDVQNLSPFAHKGLIFDWINIGALMLLLVNSLLILNILLSLSKKKSL